jgi:hypothetical protein
MQQKELTFLGSSVMSNCHIGKAIQLYERWWHPFDSVGGAHLTTDSPMYRTRGLALQPGFYEWPFQIALEGSTTETIEGIRKASIKYRLKATITRRSPAYNMHTSRQVRFIRIVETSASELCQPVGLEGIGFDKVEYSIEIPQRAVVLGSSVPLEVKAIPLVKGLELRDITIWVSESQNITLASPIGAPREYCKEREITRRNIIIHGDSYWQSTIDITGRAGWVVKTYLSLPGKLSKCLQDVHTNGIRIRHQLRLVISLRDPAKHISQLRATIPLTLFISPDIPFNGEGNLSERLSGATAEEVAWEALPVYGEHVQDQLLEENAAAGGSECRGGGGACFPPRSIFSVLANKDTDKY